MKHILVVDDDIHIGNLLQEALEGEGYRVSRAYSGTEALMALDRARPDTPAAAFTLLKADFDRRTGELKKSAAAGGRQLSNLFAFCEAAFGDGQELLILVTELTVSHICARFIGRYGCKEYFQRNRELLFYERQLQLLKELGELDLPLDDPETL